MAKHLVIVESPAKAKTIGQFLGKDFEVKSSFGHIRDLPKKGLSIDKEHGYEPTYEITADKKKVVAELRKAAKNATDVWLASDEDREGEAIAWHLCSALKLDPTKTKRIVFHEITKHAIEEAASNPRTVDINLVNAQQARRILDRLVGYELSPVLWKKIQRGLSAGRVQSVAVRLIVEREREIRDHDAGFTFKVTALFSVDGEELKAELPTKFEAVESAEAFLKDCLGAEFTVTSIETKPGTRNPGAPFTTSTLQQEASRRLGYGVKQTMVLAQRLYENGHITYMRTDSVNLSGLAIGSIGDYIKSSFGESYHQVRQFKTKSSGAQEAHEAIRPTHIDRLKAGDDPRQEKLYQLIWQRAVASQMAPAKTDKTEVSIGISTRKELLKATGEMLVFDGFLKVYGGGKDDSLLPPLTKGQALPLLSMMGRQTYNRAPARYSEASLVKTLEENGIGRPSTYAPTISTIQDRGYVEKKDLDGSTRTVHILELKDNALLERDEEERYGADRAKLTPTSLAEMTTDFLKKYFASIVDYEFTAKVENQFDNIADGKETWQEMIDQFYTKDFAPLLKSSEEATRGEATQMKELGKDPKSGKPVFARFGRYGPMLQIGEATDEEKPKFAPLPAHHTLDTITLEDALEMFKLPRLVGKTNEGVDIKANIGRFGPYIQVDKKYYSLKEHDPLTITEAEAHIIITLAADAAAKATIQTLPGGVRVLNGRFGPYVTDGTKNARIPKSMEPEKLTLEQAQELLTKAAAKPAGGRRFGAKNKASTAKSKSTSKTGAKAKKPAAKRTKKA